LRGVALLPATAQELASCALLYTLHGASVHYKLV
jgi:hypothetical protein